MAAKEDLISWLTAQLASDRQAMREQLRVPHAMVEERHKQLLAEMQVYLQDARSDMKAGDNTFDHLQAVKETMEAEQCKLGIDFSKPQTGIQMIDQAAPAPAPPDVAAPVLEPVQSIGVASAPTISAAVSDRFLKIRTYKNRALQSMAQHQRVNMNDCFLRRLVQTPAFELVCGLAIIVNTMILATEIEYNGFDSGHSVGYKQYAPSKATWPGAEPVFNYVDVMFVVIFALELVLRIGADGLQSAKEPWIWFDTVIVVASVVSLLNSGSGSEASLDPTLLRVARLARMMRVFKMVKFVRAFDSLFLLIKSIQASVSALFWSFLLLFSVELAIAMCLSQGLRQYIQNDQNDVSKRRDVFLLYGTFTRSMVTMFEITLGNWVPSCRILMNNVSEWFGLFYILYCCCFIFAVIRVIQAVFIAETNRVVTTDDQIAIMRKQRDKDVYLSKLHILFEELDKSGDGCLSRDEVSRLKDDKLLKTMMSTLDINTNDIEALFELLDDGDGEIAIEEFIKGLSRVKGNAQAIDVVSLLKMARKVDAKVDHILKMFGAFAKASTTGVPGLSAANIRGWIVDL